MTWLIYHLLHTCTYNSLNYTVLVTIPLSSSCRIQGHRYTGSHASHKSTDCRLNEWLSFYVPLKNISLIWIRHHYWWRAAKFRSMLGAPDLWAKRDLYRATPAVIMGLSLSGLIRRTASTSHFSWHYGMWRTYSNPDTHRLYRITCPDPWW
jgi:hypothetical protein